MSRELAHLAVSGTTVAVRVTPRAARNAVTVENGAVHVRVTVPPADGKANAAVQAMLADALGVAKSRLRLVRGASARDKVFAID